MNSENKKSDAEDILSEFQKTHGDEPVEEPQAKAEPVEEPQVKAEPVEEPQVKAEPVEEHR